MSEQPIEQRTNPPTRFLRRPEVTGPHGSVAEHDQGAAGARGTSPGRSRWAGAPWAGSRRRWTSGSASGSQKAAARPSERRIQWRLRSRRCNLS